MAAPVVPSVHWTTYVQTFAVIASTVGTFIYVYFTYHIMKWAVGQGAAALNLSKLADLDAAAKRAVVDDRIQRLVFNVIKSCLYGVLAGVARDALVERGDDPDERYVASRLKEIAEYQAQC